VAIQSCSQAGPGATMLFQPVETSLVYELGDRKLELRVSRYGEGDEMLVLNLHDDERTSVEAAKPVLAEKGGLLLRIANDSQRLITFTHKGRDYRFDPNRIFSRAGVVASLQLLGSRPDEEVIKLVEGFARFVLEQLPREIPLLLAVHNNDEGRLSVDSYRTGGNLQREAALVHKEARLDPDNFFLTTDEALYQRLSAHGYNVVLQDNERATDDGSLSVYCGKMGIRYVNVEARHGQLQVQEAMIRAL